MKKGRKKEEGCWKLPPSSGFLSEQEYLYLWEISENDEYFVGRR